MRTEPLTEKDRFEVAALDDTVAEQHHRDRHADECCDLARRLVDSTAHAIVLQRQLADRFPRRRWQDQSHARAGQ